MRWTRMMLSRKWKCAWEKTVWPGTRIRPLFFAVLVFVFFCFVFVSFLFLCFVLFLFCFASYLLFCFSFVCFLFCLLSFLFCFFFVSCSPRIRLHITKTSTFVPLPIHVLGISVTHLLQVPRRNPSHPTKRESLILNDVRHHPLCHLYPSIEKLSIHTKQKGKRHQNGKDWLRWALVRDTLVPGLG